MRKYNEFFKGKKADFEKLISFGFKAEGGEYTYSRLIADNQLKLTVCVSALGEIFTEVIDLATNEEYVVHLSPDAEGAFVGMVRESCDHVLSDISEKCFVPDVFKSDYAKKIISYVKSTYGDELEFLWKRFPDNAIWRRKDTNKWYAALLNISKRKLGLNSDEIIEIIDLRLRPEAMGTLIDNQNYFPGYHMNKKHWYTICLDGSVKLDEIFKRIDESYILAVK